MTTRDINLFSYHGAYFSNQNYAMTDEVGGLVHPPTHQDTLKFSGRLTKFTGKFGVVYGGTEDCADFNDRCTNVSVDAEAWVPQGQYCFTIKGGCRNIELGGRIAGAGGTTVDVDIGNWSDQCNERTTGVVIDCWKDFDVPVVIRVLNGDKPTVLCRHRYVFPHPDAWYHGIVVWVWLKVWGLGKKVGVL